MSQRPILIIEGQPGTANSLLPFMRREGFDLVIAPTPTVARGLIVRLDPLLILLDMPASRTTCRPMLVEIRQCCASPLIVLSAMVDESEKIGALRLGADDYLHKPFSPREAMARMQAVLRRVEQAQQPGVILECEGVWVDLQGLVAGVRTGRAGSTLLALTKTELLLLAALLKAPHKTYSRDELLSLSMPASDAYCRVIDTHIHNLRHKLRAAGVHGVPLTVRAAGYRFNAFQAPAL
ncbi:response regulator transcription factor [Pseudomonas sp. S75]|uniref:response regulator transcription factor n=1 Tax=unclassified Pseudomonas TaxID=196821 RepID=UPI0019043BA6|nr:MULTISPECIES: response regulator transcription factor [unclassified Pseudomonas]MBJ9975031.1 response regulator transcription factor [Pseudomonas sp. S30]MBK0152868.1 response regulator transcription factor [Pseudomonas sp. S75]